MHGMRGMIVVLVVVIGHCNLSTIHRSNYEGRGWIVFLMCLWSSGNRNMLFDSSLKFKQMWASPDNTNERTVVLTERENEGNDLLFFCTQILSVIDSVRFRHVVHSTVFPASSPLLMQK